MTDNIIIDRNLLILNNLSLADYYFLNAMHKKTPFSQEERIVVGLLNQERLQDLGFIKITTEGPVLRHKDFDLFEDAKDNFYRFLNTFPIKTPKGRYLSPSKLEGVAVEALKAKWNKLFKGQRAAENRAIEVLEAEVAHRNKTGDQEYMNACEAWLNQANYEKYEYLLEEASNLSESDNNELM